LPPTTPAATFTVIVVELPAPTDWGVKNTLTPDGKPAAEKLLTVPVKFIVPVTAIG
jgi:hypothetical protein